MSDVNIVYYQDKVWQFRVEIKGYSVAYFDRISAFEALYHESSAIRRFKHSTAIKIRNGITFDFYTGLAQFKLGFIFQTLTRQSFYSTVRVTLPFMSGVKIV